MNILESIIMGVVQGVTEFLPISSSGHTFLLDSYFGIKGGIELAILLHVASLLAVLIYFRKDISELLVGLWSATVERKLNKDADLALKLGVATVLTVPTALLTEKVLPFADLTPHMVAYTLIITGLLILFSEYLPKKARDLTWGVVVLLGLIQGLAVVPGISRSGLTIAFLVLVGIARRESARVSFLLAIPTILGAFILTIKDLPIGSVMLDSSTFVSTLLLAFVASFASSIFSIKYMLKLIEGRWVIFAPYCFALAFAILLF